MYVAVESTSAKRQQNAIAVTSAMIQKKKKKKTPKQDSPSSFKKVLHHIPRTVEIQFTIAEICTLNVTHTALS